MYAIVKVGGGDPALSLLLPICQGQNPNQLYPGKNEGFKKQGEV